MRKAIARCSGFSNESLIHPAAQPASGFFFRLGVVIPASDFSLALRGGSQWRRDSATHTGSGVTLSAIPFAPWVRFHCDPLERTRTRIGFPDHSCNGSPNLRGIVLVTLGGTPLFRLVPCYVHIQSEP